MLEGFYSRAELELVKAPPSYVPKCGACGLCKTCNSPKMTPYGLGRRKILVVGEAPGRREDEKGRPFVGKTGNDLRRELASCGIDLDKDCWAHNAVVCRPPPTEDGKDVKPTGKQLDYCRPNLNAAIRDYDPVVIILLGSSAVDSMIGRLWRENPGDVGRWVGYQIPSQELNAWVCATYHPSYVGREDSQVLRRIWHEHLLSAVSKRKRPWDVVPRYQDKVEVYLDTEEAAATLEDLTGDCSTVAFDYETNMLKPEGAGAEIVCCAVSDGNRSVAFPWRGKPVELMRELLKSDVKKVAQNMKFEDRWTRAIFGFPVNNWDFDTMVMGHVLDNRPGVTGLKFQSFVSLGQPIYDKHIAPFLKSKHKGGHAPNRIRQAPVRDLLTYCGMDAILEYELGEVQRRRLRKENA